MKTHRKIPLSGVLFLIVCISILCSLGTWQIQRLHWKNALIRNLDVQEFRSSLPKELDGTVFLNLESQKPPMVYGTVYGRFHHDLEMRVGPRTYDGQPGYHLITPLSLTDKSGTIFVNRGWVPLDKADPSTRPEDVKAQEPVDLIGMARFPDKPNFFTPDNDPTKQTWYSIDAEQMAQATGLGKIPAAIFYAEVQHNPHLKGEYPVMVPTRTTLHNNHLQYAIFWFGMAFLFAALPVIYMISPQKPEV